MVVIVDGGVGGYRRAVTRSEQAGGRGRAGRRERQVTEVVVNVGEVLTIC